MNIKKQILLLITFLICVLVMLGISINASLENYSNAVNKTKDATQIVSDVFERRLLVDDYILYSGERAKEQWFIKNNTLKKIISSNKQKSTSTQERDLLNSMEQTANYSETVFKTMISREGITATESAALTTRNLRLARQLSGSAQETISSAKMLYTLSNTAANHALQQIIFIFVIAALLFSLLLSGSFWIIWRSTNKLDLERAKDEAILSSIGDGLVAINTEGKVTLVNKAVETILGWKPEELIGKSWIQTVPILDEKGDTIPQNGRPIEKVIKEGSTIESNKYSYLRKDAKKIPVSITVAPIVYGESKVGVIEVFRDITHERDVDRMKTEFISLASHQLRTPLTSMKWFLEILLAGDTGELTGEQKEMVQSVNESNERMIDLVNSLLNVSRIESGRIIIDPEPTDLAELIKQVETDLKAKIAEKHHSIIISASPVLPKISIDQKLIRQVYMNLLTNAIKYTPDQGKILVFISQKGDQIISQITDNGYGIPAKDHNKVFQKFYRGENIVKEVTDGNGLGMYLVKTIVESSKGHIWFESEEGKGTTFWFSLPITGMEAKKGEVTLS